MSDEWVETTLGEVVSVSRERVDPRVLEPTELIHYSIPVLDATNEPASEASSLIQSHKFKVSKDSILVSLLNPRIPRVWLARGAENAVCSTEFAVVSPRDLQNLLVEFLHLLCQTDEFWIELQKRAVGSTGSRQRAKVDGLLGIPTSLPPLPVQRRIVDLIAHLDNHLANLQTEREAAESAATTLREYLFNGAAEGDLMPLAEVADWYSGSTPKAGSPEYYEGGTIPWAVIADVLNGPITETATLITEAGLEKIGRLAPIGAVLVTMYGTIGRVGLARVEMATNQAIAWGTAKPNVLPEYLFHALRHLGPHLDSLGRGATQRNINREILRSQLIRLPGLERQREIVAIMNSMNESVNVLATETLSLERLRGSMLSALLAGSLIVPNDYDSMLSEVA